MLKNTTYQEKFAMLSKWMPSIVESIKKDLKTEHLKKDWGFVRQYFPGKNPAKLTTEELSEAYINAIQKHEKAEELAEFICNRWLLKHTDLYHFFEQKLTQVDPNFSELEILDKQASISMMEEGVKQFGAPNTYLFCVFNSVVFPEEVYKTLSHRAEQSEHQTKIHDEEQKKHDSIESMQRNHDQQIARLTDKYEKKLQGLQKKYSIDIESLKKQLAVLQRKINGQG